MAGEIDALVEVLETQRAGILKKLSGISQTPSAAPSPRERTSPDCCST
jgi:hypothetical protein